ncbi:group III truncated hemoglobin [Rhodococcus sp. NPDC058505]|uniref:group III truncated hemoglobin n=1 Tax=unclassified Rhodococcus (in: high G+C Gram-positive bacteria) TaxID=192944 RepID=UPI00364FC2D1
MRADIADRADIGTLLRRFYGRALVDELLAEPFTEVREQGLESHLPVMCDFWETLLFAAGTYRGSLFRIHQNAHDRHPFGAEHFDRWLQLWHESVDEAFTGPIADRAKQQGERIAVAMHRRMTHAPSLAAEAVRTGVAAAPTMRQGGAGSA